jgi:hypothetical protein
MEALMANTICIGDIHAPATRKGYLKFCKDVYTKYKCNKTVFLGDIVDWHAISRWTKQPECPGSADEYELARTEIAKWYKAFPVADVCIGNHDERPMRLAKTVQIPEFILKSYSELWKTPKWTWAYEFEREGITYTHGTNLGGVHPAWEASKKEHGSVIIGHVHARAEIVWSASTKLRIFGMSVGCGIDQKAYQFAYGMHLRERPFLAVGVVIDGVPQLIPMPVGKGERYHDSRFPR